jgi:tetratricopeptide (TPR) repeat protein
LSLQVLDDIYLQLSPDRIWVLSDVGAGGEACACLGLRAGAGAAILGQRHAMQVRLSEETASLLNGLLIFYDRLAEQSGDDSQVKLQSAIARRRIGDIRQRLGQLALAEMEYAKAIRHLNDLCGLSPGDMEVVRELARTYNELGNVQTAQLEHARAQESHGKAMRALESRQGAAATSADFRYEMARTHYLLGNKVAGEPDRPRHRAAPQDPGASGAQKVDSRHCRAAAVDILESLIRENPGIPEYRFLVALCHRPMAADGDGVEHSRQTHGRLRAVEILEELKTQYPEVADYRYELAVTLASVQVGLFPWQSPASSDVDAEKDLLKALDEAHWLVTHNPSIPGYLRSEALILAKLGALQARRERLADAQDGFQRAFDAQCRLVASFTDASAYDRVLMEFYRLRLAQVCYLRSAPGGQTLESLRDALNACIDNLKQLARMSELADDRLTCSALPLACETLHHVLMRMGDDDAAEKARAQAREIRDALVPRSG